MTKDAEGRGPTRVQQDTGGSSVKDTADDACFGAVTVIRLSDAETDSDADWRTDRVKDCGDVSCVVPFTREIECG